MGTKATILLLLLLLASLSGRAQTSIYSCHEGDSTTYGQGVNGSNYVFFLQEMAAGHAVPVAFTNLGLSSDTISNNVAATDTLQRLSNAPAGSRLVVNLYLGLNDIQLAHTYATITTNLLTWVTNVNQSFPLAKIIMHTVWARTGDSAGTGLLRTNVNNWIRSNAPVHGVVDSALDDRLNPNITPDNFIDIVHPSVSGHRILATNVYQAMLALGYWSGDAPNRLGNINIGGNLIFSR